jgi:glutamate-ammonia-ligase adenylyltransferase
METRSDGPRPLDVVTWAQRFAQRLVMALTAPTRRGTLYEVDLRLRPSGGKGPLAVRLSSFVAYQTEEAELWEHMALTKARVVAGDEALGAAAMNVVAEVLARRRDPDMVARAVREMRATIADSKGDDKVWDLKLVAGGLTDIDFCAEALILAHAADHPDLLTSDIARVFAVAAGAGLLTPEEADILTRGHRLMNDIIQWQRLTIDGAFDPKTVPGPVMRLIARAAHAPDQKVLAATLAQGRAGARRVFERVVRAGPRS